MCVWGEGWGGEGRGDITDMYVQFSGTYITLGSKEICLDVRNIVELNPQG